MAGKIPQNFIDELLSRADIVDVISQRIPLKKAGREFQACCPFHGEKTPSFTVSPSKQFYHCFGCGAHGTALGFLMEYERLSFPEAIEELATQQGLEIPREARFDDGPDHRPIYELLEQVSDYYQAQLKQHPAASQAIDYLKQRGLSGDIANNFRLGFAPPGWDNVLRQFGGSDKQLQTLRDAGLIQEAEGKRYDRLRERIIFPIRDGRGRVVGFGGRLLGDGKPKYLNSPETPVFHKGSRLYGLYEARQHNRQLTQALVVEGYMDVVALAQFGISNAVATLGTATTSEHVSQLYRSCNEIVFCFDGDRAGRAAAWKALQTTLPHLKQGRQARFLFLPDGEDPDSLVRQHGEAEFRRQLSQAQPLSEFLFSRLESEVDTNSIDGLARLAELAKPLIGMLPKGTFRDMMENSLSQRVGVRISAPVNPDTPAAQPQRKPRNPARAQTAGHLTPIRRAVALLLQYPNCAEQQHPGDWEQLQLPGIEVVTTLIQRIQRTPGISTGALVEGTDDPKLHQHLLKLAIEPLAVENDASEQLQGLLQALLRQSERKQKEQLLEKNTPSAMTAEEKQRLREMFRKRNRDLGSSSD